MVTDGDGKHLVEKYIDYVVSYLASHKTSYEFSDLYMDYRYSCIYDHIVICQTLM